MLRSAEIRRRRLRGLTSAATLTGALTAATTLAVRGSAQTPTFSTKTEAIHVTATVIDQDGRLATGLSKDDFEIRENGVPREITIFRSDTVPFAIAIMLDVSGSMVLNLGLMRRGMEQLISRFEPGDRATVGTFQGLPMINPRFTANPQRLMEGVAGAMGGMGAPCTGQWHPESVAGSVGGSAVWAAIECGIEQVAADSETPRRVVMVVTDAMDNASKRVGPSDLKKLADDYGIMIYGVGMRGSEGLNSPTLRELAEKSGGGYFQLKDFSELVPTFGRVADELRHQYIFGFTPASSDDRKRTIEVRSLRPGTTARWRRVYLQAAPVHTRPAASLSAATPTPPEPRPVNPPAGATPSVSRGAVLDALDRYERGEWRDVLTGTGVNFLSQLYDFTGKVPVWVDERGFGHEGRRRLAAATYALEVLEHHGRNAAAWDEGAWAPKMLEWVCSLLHQGAALPEELLWSDLSVALLERAAAAGQLRTHLKHVEARFPGQARWALAGAVAEELSVWPYLHDDRPRRIPSEAVERITSAYARASIHEASRTEAHVRWGYVELRLGRIEEALKHFDLAGDSGDFFVQYSLHLFRGQALQRSGRIKEAIASYERAFGTAPYAQSAAIALGAALVEDRRSPEAAAMMIRTLAVTPPVLDPWTAYLAPEMRFWLELIARLRGAVVSR